MNLKKYDIAYKKSILNWDEALPIGNGTLGGLIYGDGPLKISIDRLDLWDKRVTPKIEEKNFNYARMRKLVEDGSDEAWAEWNSYFNKTTVTPYPSKITAGRIELDFGKKFNAESTVSLQNAIAHVSLDNGELGDLEAFISALRKVGVVKVKGNFDLNLHIPNYISDGGKGENLNTTVQNRNLKYPVAKVVTDGEFTYYAQTTHTDYKYGIVILTKDAGDCKELYFTVTSTEDCPDFIENAKKFLIETYEIGYEKLKKEHIVWWHKYWNKSEVKLGDTLIEKVYYRSWYLFASTSRKGGYPMPLQGVWTADDDAMPPWRGDYHHDTNTQLSYQAYLKANHLDEGKVFVDYLWSIRAEYRKFAKKFFGVKGLLIPGTSTIDGKPIGGWVQYSLSPTMTIWTAQSFDEYYIYTGDEKFLKNRAYPMFKEIGEAISALLEEKDGKLYLPLSSSPEIFNDERRAYLVPNSNFDLALLIYLFKTLERYTQILGLDGSQYREILSKLDNIAIYDNLIMLDRTQKLKQSHRHFSHLMCLYPLHLINYDSEANKNIYKRTLFEIELYGMGEWVGFSYGMCAQIYAMAELGNSAYEKLRQFVNGFVAENGFHLNGDFKNYGYSTYHYRPFTLESSFAYCDSVHEMLMQDHQGYIHLFPAVPDDWSDREISFKKLRTCGGVLVSANAKANKLQAVSFSSVKETQIKLKNVFDCDYIFIERNQKVEKLLIAGQDIITLDLTKGTTKIYR